MKQVFNWTIGSFFRTIGRTIAFLVMGGLIYYILTINGFEFGLKELFFDKVSASTFEYKWIQSAQWKISGGTYANAPADGSQYYTFTSSLLNNSKTYFIKFRNSFTINNDVKNMLFNVKVNMTQPTTFDFSTNPVTCTITSTTDVADMAITEYPSTSPTGEYEDFERWYKSFTCNTQYSGGDVQETKYAVTLYYWADGREGEHFPCFAQASAGQNFTFSCPRYNNNIGGLVIKIWSNTATDFTLGVNDVFTIEKDSVTTAINEQTQQQQQQHEEMMDDNTTQAESEATDFFEDFEAPDIGGLGAIITAPLNTIRSLLNSTCTNLTLPLPFVNKNLSLPCMNTIYTEHFGAFFSIYQTIILAIIAYRCIRSIFFDIHGFTNPNDDRIEVMDL